MHAPTALENLQGNVVSSCYLHRMMKTVPRGNRLGLGPGLVVDLDERWKFLVS